MSASADDGVYNRASATCPSGTSIVLELAPGVGARRASRAAAAARRTSVELGRRTPWQLGEIASVLRKSVLDREIATLHDFRLRSLQAWIGRARISLPAPLSAPPRVSTAAGISASFSCRR